MMGVQPRESCCSRSPSIDCMATCISLPLRQTATYEVGLKYSSREDTCRWKLHNHIAWLVVQSMVHLKSCLHLLERVCGIFTAVHCAYGMPIAAAPAMTHEGEGIKMVTLAEVRPSIRELRIVLAKSETHLPSCRTCEEVNTLGPSNKGGAAKI